MRTSLQGASCPKRGKTQVTKSRLVFSCAFDWLRGWHEISGPITERSKTKPKQYKSIFQTQLKITVKEPKSANTEKKEVKLSLTRSFSSAAARAASSFALFSASFFSFSSSLNFFILKSQA